MLLQSTDPWNSQRRRLDKIFRSLSIWSKEFRYETLPLVFDDNDVMASAVDTVLNSLKVIARRLTHSMLLILPCFLYIES